MKACLEASGRRLHSYPSLVYVHEMANKEMELVVETLRQQIASKLVAEDVGKFDALLEAAFGKQFVNPSKQEKKTAKNDDENEEKDENASFKLAVKKAAKELGLVVPGPYQMGKIFQLHEQLQSRFGVVLIGPSGSGKTSIWKLLAKTLELQQEEVVDDDENLGPESSTKTTKIIPVVIGPKALVPKSKLFGYIDEDTREWHDGLFSSKARSILRSGDGEGEVVGTSTSSSKPKKGVRSNSANSMTTSLEKVTTTISTISWLIFDGDIDPDWVEALNSVLDDNRVLTLPSGERIDFDLARTRILFETTSLANASPATISRLGVVSVDATPEVLFQVVELWNNSKTTAQTSDELLPKTPVFKNSQNVFATVNTFLRTNASTVLSPLSTTRTLLEHIRFAAGNREDEGVALDRMTGSALGNLGSSYKIGRRRSSYIDETESLEVSLRVV